MIRPTRAPFALWVVGMMVIAVGWMVDTGGHFGLVQRVLAPDYFRGVSAYERVLLSKEPLMRGEPGFDEVVSATTVGPVTDWDQFSYSAGEHGVTWYGTNEGIHLEQSVTMTGVRSSDGIPMRFENVRDPRETLRARFLEPRLLKTGVCLFAVGLLLNAVALVVLYGRAANADPPESALAQPQ